jgi:hypothetical protein
MTLYRVSTFYEDVWLIALDFEDVKDKIMALVTDGKLEGYSKEDRKSMIELESYLKYDIESFENNIYIKRNYYQ